MLDGSGACRLKQQELVDSADADGVVDGGWELGLVHSLPFHHPYLTHVSPFLIDESFDFRGATRNGRLSSFDGRCSRSKEPTVVNG